MLQVFAGAIIMIIWRPSNFDFIAFVQELADRAHFDVIVMRIRIGTELDLFDLDDLLLFPSLGFALLGLILELTKVHDLTDRRGSIRRNFYQIEARLIGQLHTAGWRYHAYVFAFGSD